MRPRSPCLHAAAAAAAAAAAYPRRRHPARGGQRPFPL